MIISSSAGTKQCSWSHTRLCALISYTHVLEHAVVLIPTMQCIPCKQSLNKNMFKNISVFSQMPSFLQVRKRPPPVIIPKVRCWAGIWSQVPALTFGVRLGDVGQLATFGINVTNQVPCQEGDASNHPFLHWPFLEKQAESEVLSKWMWAAAPRRVFHCCAISTSQQWKDADTWYQHILWIYVCACMHTHM